MVLHFLTSVVHTHHNIVVFDKANCYQGLIKVRQWQGGIINAKVLSDIEQIELLSPLIDKANEELPIILIRNA